LRPKERKLQILFYSDVIVNKYKITKYNINNQYGRRLI